MNICNLVFEHMFISRSVFDVIDMAYARFTLPILFINSWEGARKLIEYAWVY